MFSLTNGILHHEASFFKHMGENQNKIVFFKEKSIRRVWQDGEWYFSVIDVIGALTDSINPRDYWFKMKKRVHVEDGFELSTICRQLKLPASDGKSYSTDCASVKGIFRIIQAIPSPKAAMSVCKKSRIRNWLNSG